MLPVSSLPLSRERRRIVPRYLTEADHVWLSVLLDECERYVGRRRCELDERLTEPLPVRAPRDKLTAAVAVLRREYTARTESPVSPVTIRRVLFLARAHHRPREATLNIAASELGITPEEVDAHLFADLPPERCVAPLKQPLSSAELALRTNHAIVASLLRKAQVVRLTAEGDVRALVRAVKLRGLLCTAKFLQGGGSVSLEVSGPYALFRHTLVYGRALASLLPRAARCHHFELRAECALLNERDRVQLVVRSGDPVVPAAKTRAFDSKLEERFAREFSRIALDWELIREPDAIPVGDSWLFPDFALRHRRDPRRRWLLEIVGYWTPQYLERKLRLLREAQLDPFLLCIDAARNCADEEFPAHARVLRFSRRVPATEVLKRIDGEWRNASAPLDVVRRERRV